MRRTSFDRIARGIVGTTLASLGAGCGSGVDLEGMTLPHCDGETQAFSLLEDLELAGAYDSIDLAVIFEGQAPQLTASLGERCATATDLIACDQALRDIFIPEDTVSLVGFQLGQCVDVCDVRIVVLTRGDEVLSIRDAAAMRALLAPIDTPTEAVWAVLLDGYFMGCDPEQHGIRDAKGGYEVAATRLTSACEPVETTQFLLAVGSDASVSLLDESVIESESGCVGRRPAHLRGDPGRGCTALGARLATLAQLEAASIPAFAILARDLRDHGAPRSLRKGARRARADEVRHARIMRRHATRFGGAPRKPYAPAAAPRALVDIAIENAREGCVREAYGAVVARYQAERAADPALRRSLAAIAGDEAKHATLAMRVDAWARRRLSPAERLRVERARADALAELRAQIAVDDPGLEVANALGLPRPAEARALFTSFERALFF